MTAILTACAISGFYANVGHCYRVEVPLEACEGKRILAERWLEDHGQVVRFTRCNPLVDRYEAMPAPSPDRPGAADL